MDVILIEKEIIRESNKNVQNIEIKTSVSPFDTMM